MYGLKTKSKRANYNTKVAIYVVKLVMVECNEILQELIYLGRERNSFHSLGLF